MPQRELLSLGIRGEKGSETPRINSTAGYPVTAWAQDWGDYTNATLWLTATQAGPQTNYSLSAGADYASGHGNYCCQNGEDYTTYPSGANLTGGSTYLIYDSGSVSVTVGSSTTTPVQYGSSSTSASIASSLASEISALVSSPRVATEQMSLRSRARPMG